MIERPWKSSLPYLKIWLKRLNGRLFLLLYQTDRSEREKDRFLHIGLSDCIRDNGQCKQKGQAFFQLVETPSEPSISRLVSKLKGAVWRRNQVFHGLLHLRHILVAHNCHSYVAEKWTMVQSSFFSCPGVLPLLLNQAFVIQHTLIEMRIPCQPAALWSLKPIH